MPCGVCARLAGRGAVCCPLCGTWHGPESPHACPACGLRHATTVGGLSRCMGCGCIFAACDSCGALTDLVTLAGLCGSCKGIARGGRPAP